MYPSVKIVEYGSCPKQEGRVVRRVEGVLSYLLLREH